MRARSRRSSTTGGSAARSSPPDHRQRRHRPAPERGGPDRANHPRRLAHALRADSRVPPRPDRRPGRARRDGEETHLRRRQLPQGIPVVAIHPRGPRGGHAAIRLSRRRGAGRGAVPRRPHRERGRDRPDGLDGHQAAQRALRRRPRGRPRGRGAEGVQARSRVPGRRQRRQVHRRLPARFPHPHRVLGHQRPAAEIRPHRQHGPARPQRHRRLAGRIRCGRAGPCCR